MTLDEALLILHIPSLDDLSLDDFNKIKRERIKFLHPDKKRSDEEREFFNKELSRTNQALDVVESHIDSNKKDTHSSSQDVKFRKLTKKERIDLGAFIYQFGDDPEKQEKQIREICNWGSSDEYITYKENWHSNLYRWYWAGYSKKRKVKKKQLLSTLTQYLTFPEKHRFESLFLEYLTDIQKRTEAKERKLYEKLQESNKEKEKEKEIIQQENAEKQRIDKLKKASHALKTRKVSIPRMICNYIACCTIFYSLFFYLSLPIYYCSLIALLCVVLDYVTFKFRRASTTKSHSSIGGMVEILNNYYYEEKYGKEYKIKKEPCFYPFSRFVIDISVLLPLITIAFLLFCVVLGVVGGVFSVGIFTIAAAILILIAPFVIIGYVIWRFFSLLTYSLIQEKRIKIILNDL